MNINELKRRRNKAVRQRNKSRTTGKTYKNRRMAKKVAAHNSAAKARARVNKMKQQRNKAKPKKSSWSLFG